MNRQPEITAKHLAVTCSLRRNNSVKEHLEKAYILGYQDALKDFENLYSMSPENSIHQDVEILCSALDL